MEQNLEIIKGELELVLILDVNNKYNWKILDDLKGKSLIQQIKYFWNNN